MPLHHFGPAPWHFGVKMECVVCYDDMEGTDPGLDPCGHNICQVCLQTWAEQCERQGKIQTPCPYCKQPVTASFMENVLGRPYQPSICADRHSLLDNEAQLQEWLEANHAQQCGHCGAWVMHTGGCAAMMCLCGYRWCWECQVPIENSRSCECRHLCFYDNVLECETGDSPRRASVDELHHHFRDFLSQQAQRANGRVTFDHVMMMEVAAEPCITSDVEESDGFFLRDLLLELDSPTGNLDAVPEEETMDNNSTSALMTCEENNGDDVVTLGVTGGSGRRQRRKWRRPGVLTARFWVHRWRRSNQRREL